MSKPFFHGFKSLNHPIAPSLKPTSIAPEILDAWNTYSFLFEGFGLFSGAFAVSFREGKTIDLYLEDHPNYGSKWLGSPLFISHKKAHLEGVSSLHRELTITMVINHLLHPGMILQVDGWHHQVAREKYASTLSSPALSPSPAKGGSLDQVVQYLGMKMGLTESSLMDS